MRVCRTLLYVRIHVGLVGVAHTFIVHRTGVQEVFGLSHSSASYRWQECPSQTVLLVLGQRVQGSAGAFVSLLGLQRYLDQVGCQRPGSPHLTMF